MKRKVKVVVVPKAVSRGQKALTATQRGQPIGPDIRAESTDL